MGLETRNGQENADFKFPDKKIKKEEDKYAAFNPEMRAILKELANEHPEEPIETVTLEDMVAALKDFDFEEQPKKLSEEEKIERLKQRIENKDYEKYKINEDVIDEDVIDENVDDTTAFYTIYNKEKIKKSLSPENLKKMAERKKTPTEEDLRNAETQRARELIAKIENDKKSRVSNA